MAILITFIVAFMSNVTNVAFADDDLSDPVAYFDENTFYFEVPTMSDTWIAHTEGQNECVLIKGEKSAQGLFLYDAGQIYQNIFLADWGVLYQRASASEDWQAIKNIDSLASVLPGAKWHRLHVPSDATQPVNHSLLWLSNTHLVINDLRFGENVYIPSLKFAKNWYIVDLLTGSCSIGTQISRTYGVPNLQNINLRLSDNSEVFVSSGRMKIGTNIVTGNWY